MPSSVACPWIKPPPLRTRTSPLGPEARAGASPLEAHIQSEGRTGLTESPYFIWRCPGSLRCQKGKTSREAVSEAASLWSDLMRLLDLPDLPDPLLAHPPVMVDLVWWSACVRGVTGTPWRPGSIR